MSSPCSSTHSEAAPAQMESSLKEFVTSVGMTASPAASCSQLSSPMRKQQGMEVDSLSVEDGNHITEGQNGDIEQADAEEEGQDRQNMTERCVYTCMYCLFE